MFRTIKRMLPASTKQGIVNVLHIAVGRPVVGAIRERSLALEQVFDQRISRIEASVARIEEALGAIRQDREKANGVLRTDMLTRQDLLVTILDQRLSGLERRLEQVTASATEPTHPVAAEKHRPAYANGAGQYTNGAELAVES